VDVLSGADGPFAAHEAAMPAQDRVRRDQAVATQRPGQPADEGGEHGPVCPVQARSWVRAAQDGDLVAQHEELDVLCCRRAGHEQDQPEHLPEDQVEQPQRHVGMMPNCRSSLVSGPHPTSGTPQVRRSGTVVRSARPVVDLVGRLLGSPRVARIWAPVIDGGIAIDEYTLSRHLLRSASIRGALAQGLPGTPVASPLASRSSLAW
jgi:hypothetical protein